VRGYRAARIRPPASRGAGARFADTGSCDSVGEASRRSWGEVSCASARRVMADSGHYHDRNGADPSEPRHATETWSRIPSGWIALADIASRQQMRYRSGQCDDAVATAQVLAGRRTSPSRARLPRHSRPQHTDPRAAWFASARRYCSAPPTSRAWRRSVCLHDYGDAGHGCRARSTRQDSYCDREGGAARLCADPLRIHLADAEEHGHRTRGFQPSAIGRCKKIKNIFR